MFNLITVAFAVVLVLVLAVAGLYYGGEAYTNKTQKTDYAEIVNGSSQIKGAMELYKSRNGQYPGGVANEALGVSATQELLDRLVQEDYLSGVPSGDWTIENLMIQRGLEDARQCASVNRIAGFNVGLLDDGCPPCEDAQFRDWPACESA